MRCRLNFIFSQPLYLIKIGKMKSNVRNSSESAIPVLDQIRVLGPASYSKLDREPVTATFRTCEEKYTISIEIKKTTDVVKSKTTHGFTTMLWALSLR